MDQIRRLIFVIFILLYLDIQFPPPPASAQTPPTPFHSTGSGGASAQALEEGDKEGVVIETHEKGITLTWTPPPYSLTEVEVDGESFTQTQMPYTTLSARPGFPELPLYSRLVGLPATGEAKLRLAELERETVQLAYPPLPALVPEAAPPGPPLTSSGRGPQGGAFFSPSGQRQPDPAAYTDNSINPAEIANHGPAQQMRHKDHLWQYADQRTAYPYRRFGSSRSFFSGSEGDLNQSGS
jgi:hypothetical protein